jgi:hypothetical protein
MTNSGVALASLVVYPFQPARARVLASNSRLTLVVAPVSWM